MNQYVVLQVTLKEKLIGTASKKELEDVINAQAAKGYRLHHTITTASANSTGFGGGDRIQATMVFEKLWCCCTGAIFQKYKFKRKKINKELSDLKNIK